MFPPCLGAYRIQRQAAVDRRRRDHATALQKPDADDILRQIATSTDAEWGRQLARRYLGYEEEAPT